MKITNMLRKLCLIIYLLPILTFAQNYSSNSNGSVFVDGIFLTPKEVRDTFAENKSVLDYYNSGRNKKTWGNVLLYSGITTEIVYYIYYVSSTKLVKTNSWNGSSEKVESVSIIPLFIGGAIILSSIPIKIGFSNKIKKAVTNMNTSTPKNTSYIEPPTLIINNNGIGLCLKF
jgi:hypothetical protein